MEHTEFINQLSQLKQHIKETFLKDKIGTFINNNNNNNSLCLKVSSNKTKSLEIQIRYSHSYNSPLLVFKTFIISQEDSFETLRSIYTDPYDFLKIPHMDLYKIKTTFQISLIQLDDNWWMIHPCDFQLLLENSTKEDYLINWWSIYSKIFNYL